MTNSNAKHSKNTLRTHAVLMALLLAAAAGLSSCAGGAGTSAGTEDDGNIKIALAFAGSSSSRAARAAIPDGPMTVTLKTNSGYDQTGTTNVANGSASITFKSVPVGDYAEATAVLTAVVSGTAKTFHGKSAKTLVTPGGTTISITLIDDNFVLPSVLFVNAAGDAVSGMTARVGGTSLTGAAPGKLHYTWNLTVNFDNVEYIFAAVTSPVCTLPMGQKSVSSGLSARQEYSIAEMKAEKAASQGTAYPISSNAIVNVSLTVTYEGQTATGSTSFEIML